MSHAKILPLHKIKKKTRSNDAHDVPGTFHSLF